MFTLLQYLLYYSGLELNPQSSPRYVYVCVCVCVRVCVCVYAHTHMCTKLLQSCSTLCNAMDCSPLGSSAHRILQEEYRSGLPCSPPGDLPGPGTEPASLNLPAWASGFFTISDTGKEM